jgi:hypothetical protein
MQAADFKQVYLVQQHANIFIIELQVMQPDSSENKLDFTHSIIIFLETVYHNRGGIYIHIHKHASITSILILTVKFQTCFKLMQRPSASSKEQIFQLVFNLSQKE